MADIVRYQHVKSDRTREVLAMSGERAFYERSPDWELVGDDDPESDLPHDPEDPVDEP